MKKILIYIFLIIAPIIAGGAYAKTLPPGTGLADVKANVLILLATTDTMSGNMSVPTVDFNGPNDSEPDSNEGNIHSINWSGGHVTLHTYLGATMGDYGRDNSFNGRSSKIVRDSCNNMYGKNDGNIQSWTTSPCGGTSFIWSLQENVAMSSSDGSVNCGTSDDDSDIAIYERTNELFITDENTSNTCVFNTDRQFLRKIDTTSRSDGGQAMPDDNHPIGIDQDLGVMYHYTQDQKIAVEFIHPELTNASTYAGAPTLSEQFSFITNWPGWQRDAVNDIEVDKRGDIYLADRGTGTLHKFSRYYEPASADDPSTSWEEGPLKHIGSLQCSLFSSTMQGVYGFGIDLVNDKYWGADYWSDKIIGVHLDDHRDGSHDWSCGPVLDDTITPRTRMQVSTDVIKRIMRDDSLTAGANFGLMTWDNTPTMQVEISNTGYQEIKTLIDNQNIGLATFPLDADGCTFRCGDPNLAEGVNHQSNAGAAMQAARDYYNGILQNSNGNLFASPIDATATCQNSYVIIITDSDADDNPLAVNIATEINASNLDILTYVVGVGDHVVSSNAATLFLQSLATAGGTTTPYFAENEASLVAALGESIRQVVTRPLTFSAPTIMPETTDEGEEKSYIYQSVFAFKVGTEWQGSLKKYLLNNDGSVSPDMTWDAGNEMPHPFLRKVWTAWPSLQNNLNNLTTSLLGIPFVNEMYSSEQQAFPASYAIEGADAYETLEFI